jgi:hypothetical protein
MPASEQVQMQVVHGLAAIVTRIHNNSVTLIQLLFTGNRSGRSHQMAHQSSVLSQRLRRRADVLFRNHEHMCRCLGIDVRESDAKFVFIDTIGRNSARHDLAKQAVRIWCIPRHLHRSKYFGCWPFVQGL